jgi:hypothetical protein
MALKQVIIYEGEIDPSEIEYTVAAESVTKMVDAQGQPVAVDAKGVPLVDTHKFAAFTKQVLKAKLPVEGCDPLTITQDIADAALKLAESPETTRAKLATAFAAKAGVTVKGEVK